MEIEQELLQLKGRAYLGAARVPLESLRFTFPGSRIPNEESEVRLLEIFSGYSCQRLDNGNRIPVVISLPYLQQVLRTSKLSMSSLSDTDPPFLQLPHEPPVLALSGRHRCEAAKKFYIDPQDRWWTVTLFNQDAIPTKYLNWLSEECENSMPFFDGELYFKIRSSHLQSDSLQAAKWTNRIISSSKRVDYQRLHESEYYKPFCDALDALVPFPALLFSFRLGNIRRFFRMKCPEELATPVQHMHEVWAKIMQGFDTDLLSPADIKRLQGRSPVWSSADKKYIHGLFERGEIFPQVTNSNRRAVLEERVMAIDTIIPSMTIFLENTKYLEPAAILLRTLLPGRFKGTIRQQMRKFYKNANSSEDHFWLSYQRLWMTALRLFPYLTNFKPLQDRKGHRRQFNGNYWGFFARSAIKYGFNSPKIIKIIQSCHSTDMLPNPALNPAMTTSTARSWRLKDRCGMPTEHMFEHTALFLCMENIYNRPQPTMDAVDLTPFAVARDTFLAFFKDCPNASASLGETPQRPANYEEDVQTSNSGAERLSPVARNESNGVQMEDSRTERHLLLPPPATVDEARNESNDVQMADTWSGDCPLLPPPAPVQARTESQDVQMADTQSEIRLLPAPAETPRRLMSSDLPTPFPSILNASTNEILLAESQPSGPDPWEKDVVKEAQSLRPSEAKAHFERSGQQYAIYIWNDPPGNKRFYYPREDQLHLVKHFLHKKEGWWAAAYSGESIKTFNFEDMQSSLETNRFVLCGHDHGEFFKVMHDQEAEI